MKRGCGVMRRIGIIGAGVAGIACARALAAGGCGVIVVDKGRGVGGRCATRRVDAGGFDHGAQYLSARDAAFKAHVERSVAAGGVAAWTAAAADFGDGEARYVGTPGMNAFVKADIEGLDVRVGIEVGGVERRGDGRWRLRGTGAPDDALDALVCTAPAPQTGRLLDGGAALDRVRMAPCWTLMAAFDRPLPLPRAIVRAKAGPIASAARENSKPGRAGIPERWVVHAAPDWSEARLENDREAMVPVLLDAFAAFIGVDLPTPKHAAAHRWRYAQVTAPLGSPYLDLEGGTLLAAGDWCFGPRIEAAYTSGRAAAAAILRRKA